MVQRLKNWNLSVATEVSEPKCYRKYVEWVILSCIHQWSSMHDYKRLEEHGWKWMEEYSAKLY